MSPSSSRTVILAHRITSYNVCYTKLLRSPSLCCARVPIVEGAAPVVEIPEALSILKNRPMPFFLYHISAGGDVPVADKINCARITVRDSYNFV